MSYLDAIVAQRRRDIRSEKRFVPIETLQAMAGERSSMRGFAAALRSEPPAIVAEIKRASPSSGAIDERCNPATTAAAFVAGGAAALSVLTEPRNFRGSFADLQSARNAVTVPVLCKDFIVDDFQVWKAAAFGADAVLLIVAILGESRLRDFVRLSAALSLAAVVEVHTPQEATMAVNADARIIGINNRNLETFQVDLATAPRICAALPADRIVIAESGYSSAGQLHSAMSAGIHAFLVGEALMRSHDRGNAVRELREVHAWSE